MRNPAGPDPRLVAFVALGKSLYEMSHATILEEAMNANLPKAQHSLTRLRKDYNPHLRQPKFMSQGHTHPKSDFLTLLTEELRNFSSQLHCFCNPTYSNHEN
ncbi:hypothetical protein Fot_32789 [Forsythia ovata]|uniref:Uncharacterized protein n=1 Tax=Forsythia ovata TaxID=205694 RepID=A0ABD1T8S7_9LAMI